MSSQIDDCFGLGRQYSEKKKKHQNPLSWNLIEQKSINLSKKVLKQINLELQQQQKKSSQFTNSFNPAKSYPLYPGNNHHRIKPPFEPFPIHQTEPLTKTSFSLENIKTPLRMYVDCRGTYRRGNVCLRVYALVFGLGSSVS